MHRKTPIRSSQSEVGGANKMAKSPDVTYSAPKLLQMGRCYRSYSGIPCRGTTLPLQSFAMFARPYPGLSNSSIIFPLSAIAFSAFLFLPSFDVVLDKPQLLLLWSPVVITSVSVMIRGQSTPFFVLISSPQFHRFTTSNSAGSHLTTCGKSTLLIVRTRTHCPQ